MGNKSIAVREKRKGGRSPLGRFYWHVRVTAQEKLEIKELLARRRQTVQSFIELMEFQGITFRIEGDGALGVGGRPTDRQIEQIRDRVDAIARYLKAQNQ